MKLVTRTVNRVPLINKSGDSMIAFETPQFKGVGKLEVNESSYNEYTLMGSSFTITNKVVSNLKNEETETVLYMGDLLCNVDEIFICASN